MRSKTAGKLTHRYVTAGQGLKLREAIDNHRLVKKLLCDREIDSGLLFDAPEQPTEP
jgi:hypothetical protein